MTAPTSQPQWITSALPGSAPTAHMVQSSSSPMRNLILQSQIDSALRPLITRLENLEKGNNDPSGDVRNALVAIESCRQQLVADLENKYHENFDEMQQSEKCLREWQAGLRDEVNKYCDNHNGGLRSSVQEVFRRLRALEQRQHSAEDGERTANLTQTIEILDARTNKALVDAATEWERCYDRLQTSLGSVSEQNNRLERELQESRQEYNSESAENRQHQARIERLEKTIEELESREQQRKKANHDQQSHLEGKIAKMKDSLDREAPPSAEQIRELKDHLVRVEKRQDRHFPSERDDPTGSLATIVEQLTAQVNKIDADMVKPAKLKSLQVRTTKLERLDLDTQCSDFRKRISQTEEHFLTFAEQSAGLAVKVKALDESTRKEGTGQADQGSEVEHPEILRRLQTLEELAQAFETQHNDHELKGGELADRLRALEQQAKRTTGTDSVDGLAARVAKTEELASEGALQQRVDANSAKHVQTIADLASRLGTLEGETRSKGVGTHERAQGLQERLEKLEDDSIATATDRRFESLTDELIDLQKQLASCVSKERVDRIADDLKILQENNRGDLYGERIGELQISVRGLGKDMKDVKVARGVRGQRLDDLVCKIDTVSSGLEDRALTLTKLSQDAACLRTEHTEVKRQLLDYGDSVDDIREWTRRIEEKSKSDDRSILGRIELCDKDYNLRIGSFKEDAKRLQEELQALRTTVSPRRPESLADEIRRLRHRIEESEPDDETRRQLSELFHFSLLRKDTSDRGQEVHPSKEDSAPIASAALMLQAEGSTDPPLEPSEQVVPAAQEPAVTPQRPRSDHSPDPISQPLAKRRRLNQKEGGTLCQNSQNLPDVRQTATPDEDASDGENRHTSRRSGRKGKGKNGRLENMGMVTGDAWKISMTRRPRSGA